MNRQKLLLLAVKFFGILSLIALIIVKNPYGMERFCAGSLDYGDLYRECKVRFFKTQLPLANGQTIGPVSLHSASSYRLFVMGDSFMDERRGHDSLSALIAQRLNEPEFHVGWDIRSPVCLFQRLSQNHDLDQSTRKVLILESVERAVLERLSRPVDSCPALPDPGAPKTLWTQTKKAFSIVFQNNDEKRLRFLFYNSTITAPAIERWNSLVFSLFGKISDVTPLYSLTPPFLFYYQETQRDLESSFYYPHPDTVIDSVADNLAAINKTLESQYNATLVFMPIPDPYTINHRLINNDPYDDFLPRLYSALEKRGVKTIRLYRRFLDSPDPVYFSTDTHWNARGVEIALDATRKTLGTLSWLKRR